MEEGVLPLSNILSNQSDSFMDFDYMDELLLDGCWLEAANGSEFPHFDPISPFDPSFSFPALDFNNGENFSNTSPSKIVHEDNRKRPSKTSNPIVPSSPSVTYSSIESSEQSKRWWIGPRDSRPVMERLIQAVGFMKSLSGNKDVLIQVWVPVTKGGKRVLTTNNQPFSLDLNCPKLAHYREISVNYLFPADDDSKERMGLPGRVYRNKAPEWTPDVQFFSWEEYPRVGHAQEFDVRGTLAVPILEQGSRDCLGVIEVILTKQKIQYRPELESVCKALEAVDLRSPDLSNTQKNKTSDASYKAALPEILEVLKSACDTHRLPLAQTWVPCVLQGNGGCWNSEQNTKKDCIAPVESACYVGDPRVKGFNEACYEYHLLKGQGIVGMAFQTNEPRFSSDVSACSKSDYPLSHHARMFGLKAAVAIRLRSTCTGKADFVLEFFLPGNCDNPEGHKRMLTSLSAIIQNMCQTLRVVTDKELREEAADKELVETAKVGLGQLDSDSKEGVAFSANASTSYDGSSLPKKGEKRRIKAEKVITLEVLRQHFAGSLKDAARNLGVCPTTLKRICRQNGIQRWPSRKIKKVGHSLQKIQRVIDSVQGASAGLQIGSFYSNFPELASPNASRTTHFSNPDNLKPSEESTVLVLSPTSSCSHSHSHSSSSSQCCSSGAQQNSNPSNAECKDNTTVKEEPALKRSRSDANLPSWSDTAKPFSWPGKQASGPPPRERELPGTRDRDGPRIKVTYGEDTIRFRMRREWRYKELMHEISRRFGVESKEGGYHLKYLDDDNEWVLLTCDADLEECIDVCNSTIRLSFLHDSNSQSQSQSQIRSFSIRGASL